MPSCYQPLQVLAFGWLFHSLIHIPALCDSKVWSTKPAASMQGGSEGKLVRNTESQAPPRPAESESALEQELGQFLCTFKFEKSCFKAWQVPMWDFIPTCAITGSSAHPRTLQTPRGLLPSHSWLPSCQPWFVLGPTHHQHHWDNPKPNS